MKPKPTFLPSGALGYDLVMQSMKNIDDHIHELVKEQKIHLKKIEWHKAKLDEIREALDTYQKGTADILNMPQLRTDKKLGKWTVNENTLNQYKQAVNEMRTKYDPNSFRNRHKGYTPDPIEQLASFNKRVELHKELFKQADVPYHSSPKANADSRKLYELIEKEIEG